MSFKLFIKLALLTFIPVMWWVYQFIGSALCCTGQALYVLGIHLFNLFFVLPEQTTCRLLANSFHWELPIWQCVAAPEIIGFNPSAGWIVGMSVATWLIVLFVTWCTHSEY